MAIKSKDTHVTIDFKWTKEKDDNYEELNYDVRYSFTKEFGNTVSISMDGGKEFFAFPSPLFVEVVDFLRQKGVIGTPIYDKDKEPQHPAQPVKQSPKLPIPAIGSKKDVVKTSKEDEPLPITGDPFESFTGGSSSKDESPKVEKVAISKPVVTKKADKIELDTQDILREREEAKKKAAAAKKPVIKRDHQEGVVPIAEKKKGKILLPSDVDDIEDEELLPEEE